MLIVALVLAIIGLAALVTAVVTSNALIAWVCIAASVIGVVLLIVDAIRDRSEGDSDESAAAADDLDNTESDYEDYPDEAPIAEDYDETTTDDTVAVDTEARATESDRVDGETPKN
ncbi:hypothetical protein FHR72_004075 [Mycolicibacterium iranicum]|uniref:Transmembrane protein n=1 Tax=Mycolicibacterium iranicum TaxID=912594 RepID=A0A839QCP1_MYCIR|nr:DUF308 domain-containing protein [Mycolicibacterium iranicum]MBB2992574.1 hypothetical protein [Mycolicibacterium iranicum]